MQMNEFLFSMILTELEDAVGKENCSVINFQKRVQLIENRPIVTVKNP